MRQSLIRILVVALVVPFGIPLASGSVAAEETDVDALRQSLGFQIGEKERPTAAEVAGLAPPEGTNPHLAFLPAEAEPDYAYWRELLQAQAEEEARAPSPGTGDLRAFAPQVADVPVVAELEPPDVLGRNDTLASAELIGSLGTAAGKAQAVDVTGTLGPFPAPVAIGPFAEDDGSIPLASETGLGPSRVAARAAGTIGDGPHGSTGSGTGDLDFYAIRGAAPGQRLLVDIDVPVPFQGLDSAVTVWSAQGQILATNDDDGFTYDSLLQYRLPARGDYFVSVGSYESEILTNPFNSATGLGIGTEGPYQVLLGLDATDIDAFAVDLAPGDVLGATWTGAAVRGTVHGPDGTEVIGSQQDASYLYPKSSPLPGGGNGALAHVADRGGRHVVLVSGIRGGYRLQLRAHRPGLENGSPTGVQRLFVDFDGAQVNPSIWGGPDQQRTLSPLSSFLSRWGLSAADESAVVSAVMAEIEESLAADIRARGGNPSFNIQILNSRDHADPWGEPDASRVIVGGTIAESGVNTIGIAETIDPGNYQTGESALVLLDLLSGPPTSVNSLNRFAGPGTNKVALVGAGLGNLIAHEAGHMFGNFHTDQANLAPNLMDQGGSLANLVGVGPDGIYGTADDVDVVFGPDTYVPSEGFTGTHNTLQVISFGLPSVQAAAPSAPAGVTAVSGSRSAWVTWQAPGSEGGKAVTGWVLRAYENGALRAAVDVPGTGTAARFGNLLAGRVYTFTVAAVNTVGQGPESAPSPPVRIRLF